ncbi:hypothetical protein CsSME_00007467 [Camellia sinensis var. sinensis]
MLKEWRFRRRSIRIPQHILGSPQSRQIHRLRPLRRPPRQTRRRTHRRQRKRDCADRQNNPRQSLRPHFLSRRC